MDDTYRINAAKSAFREAYNRGDVEQLLSVFEEKGFTDMSEGAPNQYGRAAREALRDYSTQLFAKHSIKLTVIVNKIVIVGHTAYEFGWHEFNLTPKDGGQAIRKRQRYFEVWKKNSAGDWKISLFINNADVREEFGGHASHWFLTEETPRDAGDRTES